MQRDRVREAFRERGYAAPISLFGGRECASVLDALRNASEAPHEWHKGCAAASPAYFEIATDPRVLDLVTAVLGDDVLLWGASLVLRRPGHMHPWHTDIESASATAECASLWIGLQGTSAESSLAVVPYSHRFGVPLQQAASEDASTRAAALDADVARWAQRFDPRAEVVSLGLRDGEAVLFDGRLWHGSRNRRRDLARHALLLQFATPRTPIRMPRPARFEWPFETLEVPRPPCLVVSGSDARGLNRVVAGPAARGVPALRSCVHAVPLPLERETAHGWKPHPLFRGATPNLKSIGCHVSVLEPGCEPHPPHTHAEEEILLVLDGQAILVLAEHGDAADPVLEPIEPGTFSYYPAGFAHTIRNVSDSPVTYMMFKWRGESRRAARAHAAQRVRCSPCDAGLRQRADGFATRTVFDGETTLLRHLHAHVSRLEPGGGYAPHADAHDVAIVVLAGSIETGGERVAANGVAFFAAGQLHGMRNPGDEPAIYLVFEFHGAKQPGTVAARRRGSRRLRGRAGSLLRSFWRSFGA